MIVVTGAAGYIGSKLCTKLVTNGYKVTGVDILKYDKNSNYITSNLVATENTEVVNP